MDKFMNGILIVYNSNQICHLALTRFDNSENCNTLNVPLFQLISFSLLPQ